MKPNDTSELETVRESTALATGLPGLGVLNFSQPFARRIFVLSTYVAGPRYCENIEKLAAALTIGDPITLRREPSNPYDELAILVLNQDGAKLGYIPRAKNQVIARLMDAGKCFEAEVELVQDGLEGQKWLKNLDADDPRRREWEGIPDIHVKVYMVD